MCYSDIKSDREDFEMLLLNKKKNLLAGIKIVDPLIGGQVYFVNEAIAALQGYRYQECKTDAEIRKAILVAQFQGFEYGVYMPIIRYDEKTGRYRRVKEEEPEFTDVEHNLMLIIEVTNGNTQAILDFDNICALLGKAKMSVQIDLLNLGTGDVSTITTDYEKAGLYDSKSNLHTILPGNLKDWRYITFDNVPDYILGALNGYSKEEVPDFQYDLTKITTDYDLLYDEKTYKVSGITGWQARFVGWKDRKENYKIIGNFLKAVENDPVDHDYGFNDEVNAEEILYDVSDGNPELFMKLLSGDISPDQLTKYLDDYFK